jgi:hypothetical protein
VNTPEQAAAQVEMLTRDADAPEEASGESVAPPPPSKLVATTLAAATAANGSAANGSAAGVNGIASKLAGMKGLGFAAARPPVAAGRAGAV